jgi:hypothetical protein
MYRDPQDVQGIQPAQAQEIAGQNNAQHQQPVGPQVQVQPAAVVGLLYQPAKVLPNAGRRGGAPNRSPCIFMMG